MPMIPKEDMMRTHMYGQMNSGSVLSARENLNRGTVIIANPMKIR